ncbi:leucine-rich repeat-containing protein 72 [Scyliorhinus canicula]|uniref:leucine-rich repeat-containing protein 72 n=1 Tax=Scyliorhinus canicula TaxID=7830 RepID=UPI0018F5B5E6|nr:leucine-rich repeat-containing protein 72 [Scyliorhinus canicula]
MAAAADEVIQNQLKTYKIKTKNDLDELYLANKGLTEMPDLSRYKMLKYLWVNQNKIKNLDFLRLNIHLKELYLSSNLISEIAGALKNLTSLRILMLQNNWLHGVDKVVAEIKKSSWLHTLNLFNNPLTQDHDYRLYVIYHLPSVQLLDRQIITQKERDIAFGNYNQDRFRIHQSLAFGQRKPYFTVQEITPNKSYRGQKISIHEQKDVLKREKKVTKDPYKNVVDSRIRRRSIMQFSTLDWNKVPNAQQKRLGDEPLQSSQIITTQFR